MKHSELCLDILLKLIVQSLKDAINVIIFEPLMGNVERKRGIINGHIDLDWTLPVPCNFISIWMSKTTFTIFIAI